MLRMDMRTREQYLKFLERYVRARKTGKTAILDEYGPNVGLIRRQALMKRCRPASGRSGRAERSRSNALLGLSW